MTFKFRVGQKLSVSGVADLVPQFEGFVGICTDAYMAQPYPDIPSAKYYDLEGARGVGFREDVLKPIYDGDSPSTWNECAWRPNLEHPVVPSPNLPVTEKEHA